MTGVFKVLTASDIPAGGKNDVNGPSISGLPMTPEEVLVIFKRFRKRLGKTRVKLAWHCLKIE